MNLTAQFKVFLESQKKPASRITIRNYITDLNQFVRWYEKQTESSFHAGAINPESIASYKSFMLGKESGAISSRSFQRHLSSLRKFASFAKEKGLISHSPFEQIQKKKVDPLLLVSFRESLYLSKASSHTIKNYINDLTQFQNWLQKTSPEEFENDPMNLITDQNISEFRKRLVLESGLSALSINRKLSSLRKYLSFIQNKGAVGFIDAPQNMSLEKSAIEPAMANMPLTLPEAEDIALSSGPNAVIQTAKPKIYSRFAPFRLAQRLTDLAILGFDHSVVLASAKLIEKAHYIKWIASGKQIFTSSASNRLGYLGRLKPQSKMQKSLHVDHIINPHLASLKKELYATTKISLSSLPFHKKAWFHMRNTRPNWYKKYHSYSVVHYFHFAALIVLMSALGFGLYRSFIENPQKDKILAAPPTAPPRILSFQGRLTDTNDNPITTAKDLRFAIYNDSSATGSALLWQETQKLTPDQDGIFSVLLGSSTSISSSVFTDNSSLYLGITVQSDSELAPRQQIATVAFAANAETLQGLLPSTGAGAGTTNVVLALDSSGNLTIGGSANPTFSATGGTFTLSGKTLALNTTAGSNGNVTLTPDGVGIIQLNAPVQNANSNYRNNISTAKGAVEIDDMFAILATSSGQSAFTIEQQSTGPLISASTSGVAKFTVSNSGSGYFASTLNVGTTTVAAGGLNVDTGSNIAANIKSSSTETQFQIQNSNTGGRIYTFTSTSNSGGSYSAPANSLAILDGTAGATRFAVNSSGNIAIGAFDPTSFKLQVDGNVGPNADSTYNLGSASLRWNNLYVNNIFGASTGTNGYWQRTQGAVIPANITDDLLLGATSTTSAKFGFINVAGGTPTATISSNFSLQVPTGNSPATTLNILNGGSFNIRTSGLGQGDAGLTSRLFINNNGNVGVGTTAPLASLDVREGAVFRNAYSSSTPATPFASSSAEFLLSSNSLVTIGESVEGNANPHITLYRTGSGNKVGTAARMFLASSNFDFRIQQGTNNQNYGAETYTDRLKIDASGNLTITGTLDPISSGTLSLGTGATTSGLTLGRSGTTTTFNSTAWTATPTISGLITATSGLTANGALTANSTFTLGDNGDTGSVNTSDWDISTTGALTGISGITNDGAYTQSGSGINYFTGNVGIGSTTPVYALDVVSGDAIAGSFDGRVIGGSAVNSNEFVTLSQLTGGTGQYWQRASGTLSPTNITDDVLIGGTPNATASALIRLPGLTNQNAFFNLGTGNLGIGTTSPVAKLDVNSSLGTTPAASITARTSFAALLADNKGNGDIFAASSSGLNRFVIRQNGNVGIGTALPSQKLYVDGNIGITAGAASSFIGQSSLNGYNPSDNGGRAGINAGASFYINLDSNNDGTTSIFQIAKDASTLSGGTQLFTVNENGNVGIGTTTNHGFVQLNGGTQGGNAALVINQTGASSNDIFSASASGTTRLTLANNGSLSQIAATTTGNAYGLTASSLTTGNGFYLNSTSTGLSTGNLASLDWSPGSSTIATGDLLTLNVGANGTLGNIFNVKDNSSSVFSVSQSQITAALPTSFTAAGDTSFAYDINFTNPTASYIKSAAPLYIQAGELFNSSDLTLQTYNAGNVIVDSQAFVTNYAATVSGQLVIGTSTAPANIGNFYLTNSATFGKALTILNQTESNDILAGSSSGTFKFVFNQNGNLGIGSTTPVYALDVVSGDAIAGSFDGRVIGGSAVNSNEFVTLSQLTGGTGQYWQRASGTLSPTNITDDVLIGGTPNATASALIRLPGLTNQNAFFNLGTGNLGIGNTNPTQKLQVTGNIGFNAGSYLISTNDTDNRLSLHDGATGRIGIFTDGNERLSIEYGGNVGIGSTVPQFATTINATTTGNSALGVIQNTSGGDIFTASASSTTRFVINNNGNVGIALGSIAPVQALDVSGNGMFRNSADLTSTFRGIHVLPTTTATGSTNQIIRGYSTSNGLALEGGNTAFGTTPAAIVLNGPSGYISFQTNTTNRNAINASEKMRITSDGNVGIGTTAPLATLHVASTSAKALVIFDQNNSTQDIFTASAGGVTRFVINNGGNVGIGTPSATTKLTVVGNETVDGTTPEIRIHNADTAIDAGDDYGKLSFYSSDLSTFGTGMSGYISNVAVNSGVSSALAFATRTSVGVLAEKMRLDDNGNLGIGSTTPAAPLDVVGDVYVSSGISLYNTAVSDDTVEAAKFCTGDGETNCVTDFSALVSGSSYWQRNLGALSPANITDDLLLGGSATSSAVWQVYGVGTNAGTASSSGQLTFRGTTDPKINILNGENFGIRTSPGGDAGLTEKLTINNDGNIGIGSTTPTYKLDIRRLSTDLPADYIARFQEASDDDVLLRFTAAGASEEYDLGIVNSNFVIREISGATGIAMNTNGDVGIGTTTPTAALDINASTGASTSGILTFRGTTDPAINFLNGENLNFRSSPGGDAGLTSRLFINGNTGNVGIGTTAPTAKLQVSGGNVTTKVTDTGTGFTYTQYGNATSGLFVGTENTSGGGVFSGSTANAGFVGTNNTAPLQFGVNAAIKATLNSDGNLGIGSTAPVTKLDVAGNTNIQGYATASASLAVGYSTVTAGTGNAVFSGNIGIGTNAPGSLVDIEGTGNPLLEVRSTSGGTGLIRASAPGGGYIQLIGTNDNYQQIQAFANADIRIGNVNAGNFANFGGGTYNPIGSLGLGTTTNLATLHVRSTTAGGNAAAIIDQRSANQDILTASASGTSKIVLNYSGNLGLGTTAPVRQFHITNSVSTEMVYQNSGAAANTGYWRDILGTDGTFRLQAINDAFSSATTGIEFYRSGSSVTYVNFPTGNVGIGSTAPAAKLDVIGQIVGGFGAQTTAGTLDWNDTTNSRSGNGYSLLLGNATNGPGPTGSYFHPFNFEYSSKTGGGNTTQLAIPYGDVGSIDKGIYIRGRYSGNWSGWARILEENSSGNVGIGTTVPVTKVDIEGSTTTAQGQALVQINQLSTADLFTASTSGATKFVINNAGNVGIGSINPQAPLDVVGDVYVSSGISLYNTAVSDDTVEAAKFCTGDGETNCVTDFAALTSYWQRNLGAVAPLEITNDLLLGAAATSSAIIKLPGITNNDAFFNLGTGNIGIGTTTPLAKLDVRGTGIATPVASVSGTANAVAALVVDNKVGDIFAASSSGLNRFVVRQNGNVGIGSTLPTAKLDVNGDVALGTGGQIDFADATEDKIYLWGTSYGLGISSGEANWWSGGTFSFRTSSRTGTEIANLSAAGALQVDSVLQVGATTATTYSRFGTGTTGNSLSGTQDLLVSDDLEIDGNLFLDGADILGANSAAIDIGEATSGDVEITGDLLPSADATYDLGSTTKSWRNAYLTGSLCFDDTDCMSSSGGYWQRITGNLSPATLNDTISATSGASTVATFTTNNPGGTLTNNTLISHTGAGTVTNLLNLTQSAGTVTDAISINGTFTNLINATNFTLTNAGNLDAAGTLTAGTANAFTVAATGDITTVTNETINGIDISAGAVSDVTTLTSSGSTTIGTGASSANTMGAGASSTNVIGSVTTPGALTLHGATTLDNTFTVSGANLTSLGGNLTVTGTAWTATPTISGLVTMTSGFDSNAASTVTSLTIDGAPTTALIISGAATNGIDLNNTGITTDIILQNDETIDNNIDGTITLTATNVTASSDLTVSGGDITGAGGATIDIGEATAGDIEITGDLLPAADATYDLGSTTKSWRNAYLTGSLCFDDTDCMSTSGGYWQRITGNLSPANLNDTLSATTSAAVALTLTQTGAFDALLVQDASSDTSPFVINQSGNVGIQTTSPTANAGLDVAAGDIFVASGEGFDTRTGSGTLNIGETNATTLTAGAVATTLNLAAGGSATRAINIGTGTGVDTISIGTGGTGADVISIGSANAGAVSITSNAALSLTGSTNSLINFPNFDVSTAGNITVAANEGIDTNASGTLELGEVTATTVSIGGTAATTLNFGAGGALTRTINIGTGTGVDTIHIGDGGTGADVITIGSANAGAVTVRSNAALSLIGSTNSTIDFPNFDVSTAGDITTLAGGDITGAGGAAIDIGEATAGDIEITGDLLPTTDATYDLGSTTKSWRNAYLTGSLCFDDTDCISASGGYWLRNLGAVSPTNVTDDLLLGSAATSSAIIKLPGLTNKDAFFNLGTGNFGIGTTSPLAKLDVRGTGISTPVASISGQTNAVAALVVDNKVGDLFTASSSGLSRFVIRQNGNVGIGTTAPEAGLDIVPGGGTGQILAGYVGITNYAGITLGGTMSSTEYNLASSPSDRNLYINRPSTSSIYFREANNTSAQLSIITGGNVGIGTTVPTAKLDLIGDASVSASLVFGAAGTNTIDLLNGDRLDFQTSPGGDAGLTTRMTLDSNGNVGIGSTAPTQKLDVAGNVRVQGYATVSASLAVGYTSVTGGTGNGVFSGNVGIGTTNPSLARLQVGVTGGADSIAANKFVDLDGVTFGDYFFDPAAAYASASVASSLVFQKATATTHTIDILNGNAFAIRTSPGGEGSSGSLMNERLRVTNLGTIGIGTTNPLATLDLRGALGTIAVASISGQTSLTALTVDNRGNGDLFTASSSGLSRFTIKQNGNVGIGTTLPNALLDLAGSGGVYNTIPKAVLRLANTDTTATNNAVQMLFSANRTGGIQTPIASISGILTDNGGTSYLGALAFSTASTAATPIERLRIDGLGNVGIGTTNPTASLDLNTRGAKVYYSHSTNYQTTTSSTSQSFTSYGTTNIKDRLAIVTITTNSSTVTSVTYGGVAMTQLQTGTEAANRETYFFYLANPATGNQTVAITLGTSSGIAASAHILGNVNQLTPVGNSSRDTSGQLSSAITCTTPNDMVFDTVGWTGGLRPDPTGTGQSIVATASASTTHNNVSSKAECSSSPTTAVWQYASGNNATQIAAEINAVPGTNNAAAFTAFAVDRNGNVGIGTNTPTEQLEFVGANFKLSGPAGGGITLKPQASLAGNGAELPGTDAGAIIEGAANYHLVLDLRNNGSTDTLAMRYSSSNNTIVDSVGFVMRGDGNVGIGITNPSSKFEVNGTITTDLPGGTTDEALCGSDTDADLTDVVINDCSGTPASDYMELYPVKDDVSWGDIVAIGNKNIVTNDGHKIKQLTKSTTAYDNKIMGVHSNEEDAGDFNSIGYNINEEDNPKPIALAGRVRVKVNSENGPIQPGDMITSSHVPGIGMKSTRPSMVVGQALDSYTDPDPNHTGTIMVFVKAMWYDPGVYIAESGNLNTTGFDEGSFEAWAGQYKFEHKGGFADAVIARLTTGIVKTQQLVVNGTATFLDNVQMQALSVIGNIQAGSVNASSIAVNNLSIAGQSLRDYILDVVQNAEFIIQNGSTITSPVANIDQINTNIISPLAGDEVKAQGNLVVKKTNNSNGNLTVEGNASVSGTLAGSDASFSGTLRADRIIANQIEGLDARIASISANSLTASSAAITNIYNVYNTASNSGIASSPSGTFVTGDGYSLITSNLYSGVANISSLSANLAYVPNFSADTTTINQGLMVFGASSFSDTSVTGQLSIDGSFILANNGINVLGDTLSLQPLRQGNISFEGDKVVIDTEGNINVQGNANFAQNVNVQGTLSAHVISPIPQEDVVIQLPGFDNNQGTLAVDRPGITVKNGTGSAVLKITDMGDIIASGAALAKEFQVVRGVSADTSLSETVATASAGTAIIKANKYERTIVSPFVTANSLIYITAATDTNGVAPFIARQTAEDLQTNTKGSFTIRIPVLQNKDVKVNWWIIN